MKVTQIAAALIGLSVVAGATAAERKIKVTDRYLVVPVSHKFDRVDVRMMIPGQEYMPLKVRLPADGKAEYYAFRDMEQIKGKTITLVYPDGNLGGEAITTMPEIPQSDNIYKEPNRPQYHFTTRCGWINDPNGLIYHDGEYHLFYQHNPYERDWENMTWGHAVSPDLLHWTELPTAIHPDSLGTIFSGSTVIDRDNSSGFGSKKNPAMVAFYTIDSPAKQTQAMAYSLDRGRTFKKYQGNPIIDTHEKWQSHDTRDPKVFRYGDHWVMAVNERDGHSIYTSENLRDWTFRSHTTGFWECPELFELAVDGNPDKTKWVMYGASGTYMLGDFDGYEFKSSSGKHRYTGGSIYAAQTFNNIPASDGRRIQIGWGRISHPGMNFNGMMLLPTELSLRTTKDGIRLISNPVREVESLCTSIGKWSNLSQEEANNVMRPYSDRDRLRIKATLMLSHATDASLSLDGQRIVDYDMNNTTLNGYHYSPQDPTSMELTADIFIDRTSVEVFIDGGLFSYSFGRDFAGRRGQPFEFRGNRLTVTSLELMDVASVWDRQ